MVSLRQGATAPSYTERLLSGITRSGSMPNIVPKPSHRLQAPYGLLKLKKLTVGRSNKIPSSSNLSEKTICLSPTETVQMPSPSNKAVWAESAIRYWLSSSWAMVPLSMSSSMGWSCKLEALPNKSSIYSGLPLMIRREYPLLNSVFNSSSTLRLWSNACGHVII